MFGRCLPTGYSLPRLCLGRRRRLRCPSRLECQWRKQRRSTRSRSRRRSPLTNSMRMQLGCSAYRSSTVQPSSRATAKRSRLGHEANSSLANKLHQGALRQRRVGPRLDRFAVARDDEAKTSPHALEARKRQVRQQSSHKIFRATRDRSICSWRPDTAWFGLAGSKSRRHRAAQDQRPRRP